MNVPNQLSEDFVDALVEVTFVSLPGMDEGELISLLDVLLRLASREVVRAKNEERQRCLNRLSSN